MTATDHHIPYENEAKLNALMIMQRRIFQLQANSLQLAILSVSNDVSEPSVVDTTTSTLPDILARRHRPDDLQVQSRILDDVEITLLGILDSDGMLSLQSRVSEFIVLMTRVSKAEHRAVCLHILMNCISLRCAQYFVKGGGLRLLKRWMKTAEEEDCVSELCMIIKLCKILPFDTQTVKETEIGKSIKKLLKYKSETTSVDPLHAEVRALMELWTEYVKSGVSISKSIAAEQFSGGNGSLSCVVKAISKLYVQDRGMPSVLPTAPPKEPSTAPAMGAGASSSPPAKGEGAGTPAPQSTNQKVATPAIANNVPAKTSSSTVVVEKKEPLTTPKPRETATKTGHGGNGSNEIDLTGDQGDIVSESPFFNDEPTAPFPEALPAVVGDVDASTASKTMSAAPQLSASVTNVSTSAPSATLPVATPSAAPGISAFPAVGAFKLGGAGGGGLGGLGGFEVRMAPLRRPEVVGITVTSMAEKAKQMLKQQQQQQQQGASVATSGAALASGSASALTPSAGGGSSFGRSSAAAVLNVPSCLKRKSADISAEGGSNGSGNGAQQEGSNGNKRPKLSVQWADESGKTLREVMVFEVEKIKNSVKDYKSHRDLVRKERQLEKELHQSHIKEAMHPAVEWRKPDLLILPIDVRDAMESPVNSQEVEIQNTRLAHVLEARYVDDTLIPSDPDDPPASLLVGSGFGAEELLTAHSSDVAIIPWEMPGESSSSSQAQQGYGVGMGVPQLDQNMLAGGSGSGGGSVGGGHLGGQSGGGIQGVIALLPPSLRNLDIATIEMLVADDGNVAFVLNEDGSVDPGRLELVRQRYMGRVAPFGGRIDRPPMGGPGGGFGGPPIGGVRGEFRSGGGPKRSRFEDIDPLMGPGRGLGPGAGPGPGHGIIDDDFRGPPQFPPDDRMIPPPHWETRIGGGRGHMMPPHGGMMERGPPPGAGFDRDLPPGPGFDGPPMGGPPPGGKRFPSSKAHTPCRFFNTRKGCQFGDKCPFGHFREAGGPAPLDGQPPFIGGGPPRTVGGGQPIGGGIGPGPGPGPGPGRRGPGARR